jgi:hypothetical protein
VLVQQEQRAEQQEQQEQQARQHQLRRRKKNKKSSRHEYRQQLERNSKVEALVNSHLVAHPAKYSLRSNVESFCDRVEQTSCTLCQASALSSLSQLLDE